MRAGALKWLSLWSFISGLVQEQGSQIGFLLHANPSPLGVAAWNTLRGILRLQLSGPSRNESGDPLVMSILGKKVELVTSIFAALFLKTLWGYTCWWGSDYLSCGREWATEAGRKQDLAETFF